MCQFRGSKNPEILFHVSILFSTMWRTFLFNLFMRLFIKHLSKTNGRQFRLFEKNSNDFTNEWKSRFPNAHFYEENSTKINDEPFDWSLNSCESAGPELTGSRRASGAWRRSHFGSEEAVRLTVRFTAASAPAAAPSDLCSEQNHFQHHFCHFRKCRGRWFVTET